MLYLCRIHFNFRQIEIIELTEVNIIYLFQPRRRKKRRSDRFE